MINIKWISGYMNGSFYFSGKERDVCYIVGNIHILTKKKCFGRNTNKGLREMRIVNESNTML